MWIFPWIKLSWHYWSMWDKLGWLNWSWQFLCEGLYSFNPRRFYYSCTWSCSLSERRTSFCIRIREFLHMLSNSFTLLGVLLFFHSWSPSLSLCTAFDSIPSNIDEVPSIKPSANVFLLRDFNVHHKDWLIYSGGIDRPSELCYNFSISNDLTQMVTFPTHIPDCDSHNSALLDLFISSDASTCSTIVFPPLGNSDHDVVSVSIDFPINSKEHVSFHRTAYDCSCAHWDGLHDH